MVPKKGGFNHMNQDQFLGMLKIAVPSAVAWAVGKGYIPGESSADVGTAVLTVAAALWSFFAHSTSAKIAAVTAMPDIKKVITITHPVDSAVKAASEDAYQVKVSSAQ